MVHRDVEWSYAALLLPYQYISGRWVGWGGVVGERSALMGAVAFPLLSCHRKVINVNSEGQPKENLLGMRGKV